MTSIVAAATGFPPYYYRQEEILSFLPRLFGDEHLDIEKLKKYHLNSSVKGRYVALPPEELARLDGFGASNDAYIRVATDLAQSTVECALERAGLGPDAVSQFTFTTVTGLAIPSIDGRLMNRLPFPPNMKRVPLFGLGCLGGAAGLARTADYLAGHPGEAALVLSVELCSLTVQRDDVSPANLVSSGLFGDGAAAVLMVGREHELADHGQPRIIGTRSIFFHHTERVLGWDIVDTGFKIVLSPELPDIVRAGLQPQIEAFLAEYGLGVGDIAHWIAHPGGPKVLQAVEDALGLDPQALTPSRQCLERYGNVSSASVLIILGETLAGTRPARGSYGLMMAMGPSFGVEAILLQW